jgi:hypothetical protein
MWSLCGGRDKESSGDGPAAASGEEPVIGDETYRPGRGLAREMIDEQAMAPSAQVEVPAGTPRSTFNVRNSAGYRPPGGAGAGASGGAESRPATLSAFSSANATGFRGGSGSGGSGGDSGGDAQGEILGEELKKEGNQLYNEGQLEAAELVYSEALKVRCVACGGAGAGGGGGGTAGGAKRCVHSGVWRPAAAALRCARARAHATHAARTRSHAGCGRACGAPRRRVRATPRNAAPRRPHSLSQCHECARAANTHMGASLPRARRTVRAQELHPLLQPLHVLRQAGSFRGALAGRCCARARRARTISRHSRRAVRAARVWRVTRARAAPRCIRAARTPRPRRAQRAPTTRTHLRCAGAQHNTRILAPHLCPSHPTFRTQDALSDAKTVVTMMPTWAKGFARLAAALEALGKDNDAIAAYEKAKWLAQVHDNDPTGESEYDEAAKALRLRTCTGAGGYYEEISTGY